MENPATWGRAEHIVQDVLRRREDSRASGEFRCGLSLARQITDALRAEGLLAAEDKVVAVREQINDWHNSRNGFGVSLNEHLGWTDEEMKAYVLRGEVP